MPINLFADLPADLPEELIETLLVAGNVRIERIVSHGHASPEGFWYNQDSHEWIVLLRGSARLRLKGDDRPIDLHVGDALNIPAHQQHRVEWTTNTMPTIWLAVHYGSQRDGSSSDLKEH